jgi:large subunit ribosomal protein L23
MALFGNTKKEVKAKGDKTASVHRARASKLQSGVAHEIIRAPWFSEKSLIITEKGVYTFEVTARATKADIAGAIKEIYNVEPRAVRIVNLPAKRKAMRTKRGTGTRAARHKAYVYLNHGDSISFT